MTFNHALLEAILEIRWGQSSTGEIQLNPQLFDILAQKFARYASNKHFDLIEPVNPEIPNFIPHFVKFRYRKSAESWPCYQLGLGIFTINQTAEQYDEQKFVNDISDGLEIFTSSIEERIESIVNTLTINLKYQYRFDKSPEDDPFDKLESIIGVKLYFPDKFKSEAQRIEHINLNFGLICQSPSKTTAQIIVQNVLFDGTPGILVECNAESKAINFFKGKPEFAQSLTSWVNDAIGFQNSIYEQLMERK